MYNNALVTELQIKNNCKPQSSSLLLAFASAVILGF
jgi:hypothetical protein